MVEEKNTAFDKKKKKNIIIIIIIQFSYVFIIEQPLFYPFRCASGKKAKIILPKSRTIYSFSGNTVNKEKSSVISLRTVYL